MTTFGIVALVSLAISGFIAVFAFARLLIARLRAAGRARVEAEVLHGRAPRRIDEMTNFFGQQTLGRAQARGNGCLVLTDDELVFAQWVPARMLRIPLASIVGIDQPRAHLGKTIGRKLLCVRWIAGGVEDIGAWYVRELDGWIGDLHALERRTAHPDHANR